VKLVNLRAGQDSGYFFLEESVAALTYAGDNGIGRGRHEPRLPAGRGEGEPPGQPELPDDAQRGQRGPDHLRAGPEQAQGVLLGYGHGEADLSAPGGDIYDGAPDNKPEYRQPHAAGVVALAVSRFGERRRGEFGLDPRVTEFVPAHGDRHGVPGAAHVHVRVHNPAVHGAPHLGRHVRRHA
jgi:hypothetical protein